MENGTTVTRSALNDDVEQLKNDVATLKNDAVKIAQDVRSHANAQVDEARNRVNDAVAQARKTLVEHPLALFGAGVAIGFLFAVRLRR